MALEIKQQLRQTQQLVMTPQLQQAIKLLQYNHLEVLDAVEQELKENPLLEASSFDEPFSEDESDVRNDLSSLEDLAREPETPDQGDIFDVDWENYLESYGGDYAPAQRDYENRPPLENMVTYQETLFQYLLHQLQLSHIEGDDRRIALEIIGNVDENGYLDVELQELAASLEVPLEDVERILAEVQKFDPRGVAARNFKECLIIQIKALEPPHPLAERILDETLELFQQGKLDHVARKLKVSLDEVKEAAKSHLLCRPQAGQTFCQF